MGARIKLRLQPLKGKSTEAAAPEVVALANSGYEAEEKEIIIPVKLAAVLGLWPEPPEGTIIEAYGSAGGEFRAHRVPGALRVQIVVPDRPRDPCECDAVISEMEREILMSDTLASELGVATIDPARGIWAFRDELTNLRESEPQQLW